jgi:uncharacterized protein YacL (UPF0231 family)
MQLQFFWDLEGDPRALCAPPCEAVAGFLESDIQGSTALGREILRAIERVRSGRLDAWETTGNAYTLSLTADGATIQSELDDEAEPCDLPLSQIRDAVADWIAFLNDGRA